MTRGELEASIWRIAGRDLTPAKVGAILAAAEQYATERAPRHSRRALHHTGGTDLYPLIGVLAGLLLNPPKPDAAAPVRLVIRDATLLDDPALRYIGVPVSRPQGWQVAS